jgi:hypothetical protein
MVSHPKRDLRDARRELVDLNPEELIDIEPRQLGRVGTLLPRHARTQIAFLDQLALDLAQFTIRDDEEISRATCGVEERQARQAV